MPRDRDAGGAVARDGDLAPNRGVIRPGLLGAWLARAGRFRPTARVAKSMLKLLRGHGLFPQHIEAALNGRQMQLDLDEEIDVKIFLYGAFDERGLKLIRKIMTAIRCRTALDVGANIGNHTGFFCDLAERVCSFEPNPAVVKRLAHFVASNRIDNVAVFPVGLSDVNGRLDFFVYPRAAGMSTLERRPDACPAGQVEVRRGDDLIAETGISNVDLIKIDVEEHEFEVITGLTQTIARDKPVITMEFRGNSLLKFGGRVGLAALMPGYVFFGTGRSVMSKLFKSSLRLEPFAAGRAYDHLVCVPEHRVAAFRKARLWGGDAPL